MRKRILFFVTLIILICTLIACAAYPIGSDKPFASESPGGSASPSFEAYTDTPDQTKRDTRPEIEQPGEFYSYSFASYSDLSAALCLEENEEHRKIQEDIKDRDYGKRFGTFTKSFTGKEDRLLVPCINKDPMRIGSKYEWQKIVLFTSELYDLPWIWYYCDYSGETVVVCVSYLDIIDDDRLSNCSSFSEVVRYIAPDAPVDASDISENDGYRSITAEQIALDDNTIVSAVKFHFSNDRIHYRFLLDHCLWSVWSYDPAFELDNTFFEAFSVQPFTAFSK